MQGKIIKLKLCVTEGESSPMCKFDNMPVHIFMNILFQNLFSNFWQINRSLPLELPSAPSRSNGFKEPDSGSSLLSL